MIKHNILHPDIGQSVECYLYKDVRTEYHGELKAAGIWSRHSSTVGDMAEIFNQYTKVATFSAPYRNGKHKHFVVAQRFDEFVEKNGWKTDGERKAPKASTITPQPEQDECAPAKVERAPELSVAFIDAIDRLIATVAEKKFGEQIEKIGDRIASDLLRDLPALMFRQMQNGISRIVKTEVAAALDKATAPDCGAEREVAK